MLKFIQWKSFLTLVTGTFILLLLLLIGILINDLRYLYTFFFIGLMVTGLFLLSNKFQNWIFMQIKNNTSPKIQFIGVVIFLYLGKMLILGVLFFISKKFNFIFSWETALTIIALAPLLFFTHLVRKTK